MIENNAAFDQLDLDYPFISESYEPTAEDEAAYAALFNAPVVTPVVADSGMCACGERKSKSNPMCPRCWHAHKATRSVRRSTAERRIEGQRMQAKIDAAFAVESETAFGSPHWIEDTRGEIERESSNEHSGQLEDRWTPRMPAVTARMSPATIARLAIPAPRLFAKHVVLRTPMDIAGARRNVITDEGIFRALDLTRKPTSDWRKRRMVSFDLESDRFGSGFDPSFAPFIAAVDAANETLRNTKPWDKTARRAALREFRAANRALFEHQRIVDAQQRAATSYVREFYIENEEGVNAPMNEAGVEPIRTLSDDEYELSLVMQLRIDILSMYGPALFEATFREQPTKREWQEYAELRATRRVYAWEHAEEMSEPERQVRDALSKRNAID